MTAKRRAEGPAVKRKPNAARAPAKRPGSALKILKWFLDRPLWPARCC